MSGPITRLYDFETDKANNVFVTAARIDAEHNQEVEALNRKVLCSATAPANPINGQTWVDTTNNQVKCYLNNEWTIISNTVFIQASAPDSPDEGNLWYDTTNDCLKTYDGSEWTQVGDMLHPSNTVQGDMLYYTAEKTLARLAKNTNADRVLMNTGSSNAPAWGQVTREAIVAADFEYGAWDSKSTDTVYQATTDGVVMATTNDGSPVMKAYTDSSNPPTTQRGKLATEGTITMPVKKGDYWKVEDASGGIYWIPNNG